MGFKIEMKECDGPKSKFATYVCENKEIINSKMGEYMINKLVHEFEAR